MEQIAELFAQFTALDASLYAFAAMVALLARFLRSYWHGFGNRATVGLASLYGVGAAFLAADSAGRAGHERDALWIAVQGTSFVVAVLIGEWGTRSIPGLPKDDAIANVKEHVEKA